jgi:hypothetical protein
MSLLTELLLTGAAVAAIAGYVLYRFTRDTDHGGVSDAWRNEQITQRRERRD